MSVTFDAATRRFFPQFDAELLAACPEAEHLAVNMSNGNAALVCATLGIDLDAEGWCGSLSAADFLGRVLLALAIAPADEGMPSYELAPGDSAGIFGTVRQGGPRFIQGARPEGYTQQRLAQLRELAEWAVAHNAEISFG